MEWSEYFVKNLLKCSHFSSDSPLYGCVRIDNGTPDETRFDDHVDGSNKSIRKGADATNCRANRTDVKEFDKPEKAERVQA